MSSYTNTQSNINHRSLGFNTDADESLRLSSTNSGANTNAGIKVIGIAPGIFFIQTRAEEEVAEPSATLGREHSTAPKVNLPKPASERLMLTEQDFESASAEFTESVAPGLVSKGRNAGKHIDLRGFASDQHSYGQTMASSQASFPPSVKESQKPTYTITKSPPRSKEEVVARRPPVQHNPTAESVKLTRTTTQRLLPPSGVEPDESRKRYCSYWMRTGECDFSQQGCRFKHEMPEDRTTLANLGFRTIPRWYLEKMQGKIWIGANVPDVDEEKERQRRAPSVGRSGKGRRPMMARDLGGHGHVHRGVGCTSSASSSPMATPKLPVTPPSKQNTTLGASQGRGTPALRRSPGEWFQGRSAFTKVQVKPVTATASSAVSDARKCAKPQALPSKAAILADPEDLIELDFPTLAPERAESSSSATSGSRSISRLPASSPFVTTTSSSTPASTPSSKSPRSSSSAEKDLLSCPNVLPNAPQNPPHPVHFANKNLPPSPHRLAVELRHTQMAEQLASQIAAREAAAASAVAKLKQKTEERSRGKMLEHPPPPPVQQQVGSALGKVKPVPSSSGHVKENVMAFESKSGLDRAAGEVGSAKITAAVVKEKEAVIVPPHQLTVEVRKVQTMAEMRAEEVQALKKRKAIAIPAKASAKKVSGPKDGKRDAKSTKDGKEGDASGPSSPGRQGRRQRRQRRRGSE